MMPAARLRAVNDNALERAPLREQPARLQAAMHCIVLFGAAHDNHHQPTGCQPAHKRDRMNFKRRLRMLCALAKARNFLSRLNALQTAHLECEERRRGNNGKTIGDRHRKIQSVQTGKLQAPV